MSALRSLLRRPNALITSRLRPVRRHVPTRSAVPSSNLTAASFSSDATNGEPHQPAAAAKKHLYLVLDDHKKDYGIYKLDVDADLPDGDDNTDSTTAPRPRRLPRPPLIRMAVTEETEEEPSAQFAAAGSCIVATGCSPYRGLIHSDDYGIVTILYDVKRAALSVSTHPTDTLQYGYEVAVPVGKKLYVLDLHTSSVDSFHVMTTSKDGDDADWYEGSGSSQCGWTYGGKARSWSDSLPFDTNEIQAHAVHPQGRTIFLSAPVSYELKSGAGWRYGVDTFAYNTRRIGSEWRRYGRWGLPFKGQAHYDRQLNQWVGLCVDEEGEGTTGYLCACDVPPNNHKISSMKEKVQNKP